MNNTKDIRKAVSNTVEFLILFFGTLVTIINFLSLVNITKKFKFLETFLNNISIKIDYHDSFGDVYFKLFSETLLMIVALVILRKYLKKIKNDIFRYLLELLMILFIITIVGTILTFIFMLLIQNMNFPGF